MYRYLLFLLVLILISSLAAWHYRHGEHDSSSMVFGISADYPPFEYYLDNQLVGFDIDVGREVARILGKKAVFKDMQFSAILPSLKSGRIDAGISTITITDERRIGFDFSEAYYTESMAIVYKVRAVINNAEELAEKKIACQLGTTMEYWLKRHVPSATIISVDNSNQAIESLKSGHVDAVFIDANQAAVFAQKNNNLGYIIAAKSDRGYGIALPKGSQLKHAIDIAIKLLASEGKLKELQHKWHIADNVNPPIVDTGPAPQ